MIVRVITINLNTGESLPDKNINLLNPVSKQWLDRHLIWCMNNHYGVQLINFKDEEPS